MPPQPANQCLTDSSASPTISDESGISRRRALTQGIAFLAVPALLSSAKAAPSKLEGDSPFSLHRKIAFVTGAARGIGRAIAVALAEAGADIVGVDIAAPASPDVVYAHATPEDLKETGRLVEEKGRKFLGVVADTRDLDALKLAVAKAEADLGPISILVADAGIQIFAPILETTDRQWRDVIEINLIGTANTIRAVAPQMVERKNGRIILVASGQGRHGMKDGSAYSASKWGVIGLMKSVALELAEHQITVNTLEPGLVDTPMTRNPIRWNEALKEAGLSSHNNPTEEEVVAARLKSAVIKVPWLKPEDVAPVAVFLASDAARMVTGATYDATGGDSANYTA